MSKHDLENMIFNLEERKDLKKVEFTQKAVIEVLGYLKELKGIETKLAGSETKCYTLESYNNFLLDQCNKLIKENKQLKKQLEIREQIIKENKELYDAKSFSMSAMEENYNQDKISFALEQLEKVKGYFGELSLYEMYDKINNQIEELKKEINNGFSLV